MSKAQRYHRKHERIVAESQATYGEYFAEWETTGAEYRKVLGEMLATAEPPTYRKQLNRPPTVLTVNDLAVALGAVEGFGESKGGLSIARLLTAFQLCGVGKQRAKASAALQALIGLEMITKTGNYSKGKKGNKYKLTDKALKALGRATLPLSEQWGTIESLRIEDF